jgi:hypothetical protein
VFLFSGATISLPPQSISPTLGRATQIKPNAETAGSVTLEANPLALRIAQERAIAHIDEGSAATADAAVSDAMTLLQSNNLPGDPFIMFSDDAILTVQWEKHNLGVALLFAGDGLVSIAFRRPGQLYAENGCEVPVDGPLPQEFNDALSAILP